MIVTGADLKANETTMTREELKGGMMKERLLKSDMLEETGNKERQKPWEKKPLTCEKLNRFNNESDVREQAFKPSKIIAL